MPESATLTVPAGAPAARLDVLLAAHVASLTRSQAQRLVREGRVTLNGSVARRSSLRPVPGDVIAVDLPPATAPLRPVARRIPLSVAYEDEHLLVIDKPPGLPVHPGPGHADDTLVNALLARYPDIAAVGDPQRPGIVHRLDRDTSGLLIVARTPAACEGLMSAIKARTVRRRYAALVSGRVEPAEGVVDAPIGRHPRDRTRQAVVKDGRQARTRYRAERHLEGATLLSVWLDTGRMHQIRVHMASIGHPVIGDPTYGGRRPRRVPGLNRQFLHATDLAFDHPATGESVAVSSPLPPDLRAALAHFEPA